MEGHLIGDGPLPRFEAFIPQCCHTAKRKIKWLMHEEKKGSLESKLCVRSGDRCANKGKNFNRPERKGSRTPKVLEERGYG